MQLDPRVVERPQRHVDLVEPARDGHEAEAVRVLGVVDRAGDGGSQAHGRGAADRAGVVVGEWGDGHREPVGADAPAAHLHVVAVRVGRFPEEASCQRIGGIVVPVQQHAPGVEQLEPRVVERSRLDVDLVQLAPLGLEAEDVLVVGDLQGAVDGHPDRERGRPRRCAGVVVGQVRRAPCESRFERLGVIAGAAAGEDCLPVEGKHPLAQARPGPLAQGLRREAPVPQDGRHERSRQAAHQAREHAPVPFGIAFFGQHRAPVEARHPGPQAGPLRVGQLRGVDSGPLEDRGDE